MQLSQIYGTPLTLREWPRGYKETSAAEIFYFGVWRSFTPNRHLHPHAGKSYSSIFLAVELMRLLECILNSVSVIGWKLSANIQVNTSPLELGATWGLQLAWLVPWAGQGVLGVLLPEEVAEHLPLQNLSRAKLQPEFQNSRLVLKVVFFMYRYQIVSECL